MKGNQILNPPYDHYAVWHEHFFPPRGESELEYEPREGEIDSRDDMAGTGRFDAVEDRQGRIFVWDVEKQEPVRVFNTRDEASVHARQMATTGSPAAPGASAPQGKPASPQP